MLNNSGESGHPCLVPDLRGNAFSFSLRIMFAVGFPMDYIVHRILQARILEWVAVSFFRGSSQPRSPTLQVDSLPAEPQGKSKKT